MNLENKNILITGSRGFVGKHLINSLKNNNKIYEISSDSPIPCLDNMDIIFHLGAQTQVKRALLNPLETFDKNVKFTYNLLENVRKTNKKIKVIVASTDKVYGEGLNKNETNDLKAIYPYDVSKLCTDKIAQCYMKTYGMDIIITRFSNIYGYGDYNFDRIVPYSIHCCYDKEPIILRSNGKTIRDYIYIDDVIDAYRLSALSYHNGVFNFSSNNTISTIHLVETIRKKCILKNIIYKDRSKIIIINDAKNEINKQSLNSDKAKKILKWNPKYNLNRGLDITINKFGLEYRDKDFLSKSWVYKNA